MELYINNKRIRKTKNICFPICALNYPYDYKNKIEYIFSYCLVKQAFKLQEYISELKDFKNVKIPVDADTLKKLHTAIIVVSNHWSYELKSILGAIWKFREMRDHIDYYENKYGKDTNIHIKKTNCWRARLSQTDYEKFATSCAVKAYSSLMKKDSSIKFSYSTLESLVNGYKTKEAFYYEFKQNNKNLIRISNHKLNKYIEQLTKEKEIVNVHCKGELPVISLSLIDSD